MAIDFLTFAVVLASFLAAALAVKAAERTAS
jgi:hypothetical protein